MHNSYTHEFDEVCCVAHGPLKPVWTNYIGPWPGMRNQEPNGVWSILYIGLNLGITLLHAKQLQCQLRAACDAAWLNVYVPGQVPVK